MELRSYNVERIFKDCTTCVLGNLVGTRKEELEKYAADILDMIRQIPTEEVDGKQCTDSGCAITAETVNNGHPICKSLGCCCCWLVASTMCIGRESSNQIRLSGSRFLPHNYFR